MNCNATECFLYIHKQTLNDIHYVYSYYYIEYVIDVGVTYHQKEKLVLVADMPTYVNMQNILYVLFVI